MEHHARHLRGLQAFDVTASCGSLSKAADELGVTHGAVSRQIKQLENHLGVLLFHRRPNGVETTEQGALLQQATQRAFDALREGIQNVRRTADNQSITISLSASLATKWLVPKLPEFRKVHPGLSVYLDTNDEIIDLQISQVDVALRYGAPAKGNLHCELLTEEDLVVVASPSLLTDQEIPMKPEEISSLPLLSDEFNPAWDTWAIAKKLDPIKVSKPAIKFADSSVMITAAIDGQGVALARHLLVKDDLKAGRLIRLDQSNTKSDRSLYFVCRSEDQDRTPVRRFRNWLLSLGLTN